MVKSLTEVAKEKIFFNLQIGLLSLYIFSVFIISQISNVYESIGVDKLSLDIIFYIVLGIAILLILITHINIGIYFGLRMAFDRDPEQMIMISPKGQIISILIDIAIILPYFFFKNMTDNLLMELFNTNFLLITVFFIFVAIVLEIAMTDRSFSQYNEKIKVEEKVEADYTKIKTSIN